MILPHIFKCPEASADMIEYTVQNDFDTVFMQSCTDFGKTFVISETVIYMIIVVGIISVSGGHKHRAEINGIDVHLLEMGNKVDDLIQTVFRFAVIDSRRTAEAQRIDVVKN